MTLQFYRADEYETEEFPLANYDLYIFGTSAIIKRTNDFRDYIDVESDSLREQLNRCFDIANVAGIDNRLVFWLDAPRPDGEYAVITADLAVNAWLDDLEQLSRIVVAVSFDEFLERVLRFMLETERGFWYWGPPPGALVSLW